MARRGNRWNRLAWDTWALAWEASSVMGLRAVKLAAAGTAGKAEAQRLVIEKMDAALEWQMLAMTGGLGTTAPSAASKTLKLYRRKIRANRRRLLLTQTKSTRGARR